MGRRVYSEEAVRRLEGIRLIWVGQDLVVEKVDERAGDDIHQEMRDIANEPE